jgi:hypothetical protein
MRLSAHFSLEELVFSSTAQRLGIDNTPPPSVIENLKLAAEGLEKVRRLLGQPIHIDSGYRCPTLNEKVGGAKLSAHLDGWAVDFACPKFGSPLQIAKAIESSDIQFDKCIQEGAWVHISFNPNNRRILLTAHFNTTGVVYSKGV